MQASHQEKSRKRWRIFIALAVVVIIANVWARMESDETLHAADFGNEWPFTVASGKVDCLPSGALVFRNNGTTYALTGLAQARGYQPVDSIWLDNPNIPGTKISVGGLISMAKEKC